MTRIFYCQKNSIYVPENLSAYRSSKIVAARNEKEKQRMICAAEVLKLGFSSFGIEEKTVEYGFSDNGKPCAKNHPEVKFSLSHSENFAIAAFSDGEVGIDCEKTDRAVPERVMQRYFSEKEKLSFASSPILLWTAKESISKLWGCGVSGFSKLPELEYFTESAEINGIYLRRFEINGFTVVLSSLANEPFCVQEVR